MQETTNSQPIREQGILIVDDMVDSRLLLRDALESLGFKNITECCDGAQALSQIKSRQFDLIISDWLMPGLYGINLVKFLRKKSPHPKTPLIMITTNGHLDDVMQGVQAGVNDYIVKPLEPMILKRKIDKALKLQ